MLRYRLGLDITLNMAFNDVFGADADAYASPTRTLAIGTVSDGRARHTARSR